MFEGKMTSVDRSFFAKTMKNWEPAVEQQEVTLKVDWINVEDIWGTVRVRKKKTVRKVLSRVNETLTLSRFGDDLNCIGEIKKIGVHL